MTSIAYNVNKNPNDLHPHPLNVQIYGVEIADVDLIESIKSKGILEPIVIKDDNTIISGHRRWAASIGLGVDKVPCRVLTFNDALDEAESLIEFNRQRVKNLTQRMHEADTVLYIEKERAKKEQIRKPTTNSVPPMLEEQTPVKKNPVKKEATSKTAERIGMKRTSFINARAIWDAAKAGDEKAKDLVAEVDAGKETINGAFNKIHKPKYRANGNSKTSSFGTPERVGHDASDYYARGMTAPDGGLVDIPKAITPLVVVHSDVETDLITNVCYISSSENMKEIPDGSIHLMITSPPYNVGKEYDVDNGMEAYLQLLTNVFTETFRVMVDGGRVCINVANLGRKPYIPLNAYVSFIMNKIGFKQRGEIIWDKGASAGNSAAWGSWQSASNPSLRDVHEYILVFTKGDYGREVGKSTITRDEFLEYTKSIWKFNTTSAVRIGHPAPFPLELPMRLIKLYSYEDDVVLDTFVGSGQTAIAAKKLNRQYIGYDISTEYIALATKRVEGMVVDDASN